ncbi:MAG: hypothetical protein AAFO98_06270, partial [Pseudomonadota bacterium]
MPRYAQSRATNNSHVINALLIKRVELLRDGACVCQVEAVAILFGYDGAFDEYIVPRKHNRQFGRSGLSRLIVGVLRKANGPMTAREIADRFPVDQHVPKLSY